MDFYFFRCEECNFETSIKVSYMRHVSAHAETQVRRTLIHQKVGFRLKYSRHSVTGHVQYLNGEYVSDSQRVC